MNYMNMLLTACALDVEACQDNNMFIGVFDLVNLSLMNGYNELAHITT